MKLNIKSIISIAAVTLSTGMATTSCTGDLDVENINPQMETTIDGDAFFNKIYASLSLTGMTGGDGGNGDIQDLDEGRSGFNRDLLYLNGLSSDEISWVWMENTGVPELIHNSWDADCTYSAGIYQRLYYTITLCNKYLADGYNATDQDLRNAEVRFIRALNYFEVVDLFGNAPMILQVNGDRPRYTRQQLFDFVESELLDIESVLASPGTNTYGRVDKVAAWLLLARLYLNAEVYTGTAQWSNAITYAEKVINNGYYHLNKNTGSWTNTATSTTESLSAYQLLFIGDNDTNGAQYENVVVGICDPITTASWDGTNHIIKLSYDTGDSEMNTLYPANMTVNSKCYRLKKELLDKFFTGEIPNTKNLQELIAAANDDRALFYGYNLSASITEESTDLSIGFNSLKFRNVRADNGTNAGFDWANTDMPVMRIAEAYLTAGEAYKRMGDDPNAASMINEVRKRANATQRSSYTLDEICDEWSREFWMEGRRRMDLIRFNKFGGQSAYKWEWMGGSKEGAQFPAYKNIFPIPANELANNSSLEQNTGY